MKKIFFISCLFSILTGCYSIPTYNINAKFNEKEAEELLKPGKNTIKGEAFLRQLGGNVITCAGYNVYLIPATDYAQERMSVLYNSKEGGFNPVIHMIPFTDMSSVKSTNTYNFIPDETKYHQLNKSTICNADGQFEFLNIADGTFYITTTVFWIDLQNRPNGGALSKKITISNGKKQEIILTQPL